MSYISGGETYRWIIKSLPQSRIWEHTFMMTGLWELNFAHIACKYTIMLSSAVRERALGHLADKTGNVPH